MTNTATTRATTQSVQTVRGVVVPAPTQTFGANADVALPPAIAVVRWGPVA